MTPSDLATTFLALDAEAVAIGAHGDRIVPFDTFYTGPGETLLGAGEVLAAVRIPPHALAARAVFEKLNLYEGDFAIASVCLVRHPDQALRISLGAVAPVPIRLCDAERQLRSALDSDERVAAVTDETLDRMAHPLARNAWKLDAAAGLIRKAAARLTQSAEPQS